VYVPCKTQKCISAGFFGSFFLPELAPKTVETALAKCSSLFRKAAGNHQILLILMNNPKSSSWRLLTALQPAFLSSLLETWPESCKSLYGSDFMKDSPVEGVNSGT